MTDIIQSTMELLPFMFETEGEPAGPVATFTVLPSLGTLPPPGGFQASDFTATIDWGDNTTSPGTVVLIASGSPTSPAVFNVIGPGHIYDEGTFVASVMISENGAPPQPFGPSQAIKVFDTDQFTVTSSNFVPDPKNGLEGTVTAMFIDAKNPNNVASDFTATINWGDGSSGIGTVTESSPAVYQVTTLEHTYAAAGQYTITVTLADNPANDGQFTAIGQTTTTAIVAATPPTVVPDRTGVNVGASVTADAAHGVLAVDTDPIAGDTLHVVAVDGQAFNNTINIAGTFGSLTLNADGSYTYTASSNAVLPADGVGQDVFTYTASTGQGGTADSTLTVVVTAKGSTYLGGTPGVTVTGPNGHSPVLDGGAGNDTLVATKGATVLIGGPGDTLTGGKGADTYVFTGHFGQNTITNYNPNKDIIALDHTEFANVQKATTQVGANTVISDNAGDAITLIGVNVSQLHFDANHFMLV
jgi:VCBS repeat-containing protein